MRGTARFQGRPKDQAPDRVARAVVALSTLAVLGAGIGVLTLSWSISHPAPRPPSEQTPPATTPPEQPEQSGQSRQLSIWLTGYSWQDNTPPGSSKVGEPVLHQVADGTGTFADPITVATPGHKGNQEWKPGTKFYLPTVQRYVIVEDSGAADAPAGTDAHLDMWSAGQDGTKQDVNACMASFTGKVPAQLNPPDGLPVMAGPIYAGHRCNIPPQPDNQGTYHSPDTHRDNHHRHHHHSDDDDDSDHGHHSDGDSDN